MPSKHDLQSRDTKGSTVSQRILMVVNVCLAGIVCLLALKLYGVWNNTYSLSTTLANEAKVKAHNPRRQAHVKAKKPDDYYHVIVDKNLFSGSRGSNEEVKSLIPPSQMALHGCLIFGEHKATLLEVREQQKKKVRRGRTTKDPNNRESKGVKVGDKEGIGDIRVILTFALDPRVLAFNTIIRWRNYFMETKSKIFTISRTSPSS